MGPKWTLPPCAQTGVKRSLGTLKTHTVALDGSKWTPLCTGPACAQTGVKSSLGTYYRPLSVKFQSDETKTTLWDIVFALLFHGSVATDPVIWGMLQHLTLCFKTFAALKLHVCETSKPDENQTDR